MKNKPAKKVKPIKAWALFDEDGICFEDIHALKCTANVEAATRPWFMTKATIRRVTITVED